MTDLYIGLMSGTSMDGVDAVLVDFTPTGRRALTVLAHRHLAFNATLGAELLALNDSGGVDELHRAAIAGNRLAGLYADAVRALLRDTGVEASRVRAIGAHGQTVRHRPGEFDGVGYSLQLGNPSLLAERTGIDVVADFRSRDVAAGGQGAPLVPVFHRAVFGQPGSTVAVLNLGGIANLTVVDATDETIGFDCGPANALMDQWCRRHTGAAFDVDGRWAASGWVILPLLAAMRADPYFAMHPPKSTGRDRFNGRWLDLQPGLTAASPADVQATLAELTATTCGDEVRRHAPEATELLVCGGGALNPHLMERLAARLPGLAVRATDARGLPAMEVEATAFAWLARAFCRKEPGNLVGVTGAAGPRRLGALYPGSRARSLSASDQSTLEQA